MHYENSGGREIKLFAGKIVEATMGGYGSKWKSEPIAGIGSAGQLVTLPVFPLRL